MADLLSPSHQVLLHSEPKLINQMSETKSHPPPLVPVPSHDPGRRNGHLNLDTFSPVNQNGSFAFDRVLKSGEVYKRTRKTKVDDPPVGCLLFLINTIGSLSNGNLSTWSYAPTSYLFTKALQRNAF